MKRLQQIPKGGGPRRKRATSKARAAMKRPVSLSWPTLSEADSDALWMRFREDARKETITVDQTFDGAFRPGQQRCIACGGVSEQPGRCWACQSRFERHVENGDVPGPPDNHSVESEHTDEEGGHDERNDD